MSNTHSEANWEVHDDALHLTGTFFDAVKEVHRGPLNAAHIETQRWSLKKLLKLVQCQDLIGERYRKLCAALVLGLDADDGKADESFIN